MQATGPAKLPATLWIAFVAIVALLLTVDRWQVVAEARAAGRTEVVPAGALGSGATARALRELGRIHPVPFRADGSEAAEPVRPVDGARRVEAYALRPTPPALLPSTTDLPAAVRARTDIDVLSLSLRSEAAEELVEHPEQRGLDWERPGYLTFLRHGELALATGVGARVHGGKSRIGSENKSFRVYFRDTYGTSGFPAALAFDDGPDNSMTEVIAHNDVRLDLWGQPWQFVNAMAYSIAERVGCLVPRSRPVQFFLNGESQGLYFLTERLGLAYLEARFGHDNFTAARTRRDQGSDWFEAGDREAYDAFVAGHLRRQEREVSMRRLGREIDIENLTNWFVGVIFNGTEDWYQGVLAREESESGRWFWVNWDMDHSFVGTRLNRERPWNRNMFRSVLDKPIRLRSVLLTELIEDDPEYRQFLASKLVGALNHEITDEYLEGLVAAYRELADVYELADRRFLDDIEEFFELRPEVVLRQAMEPLGFGPPTTLTVEMSDSGPFEIDGYSAEASRSLRYLTGMAIEVTVPRATGRGLVGWRIDDLEQPADGNRLRTTVGTGTRIEAVFAPPEEEQP